MPTLKDRNVLRVFERRCERSRSMAGVASARGRSGKGGQRGGGGRPWLRGRPCPELGTDYKENKRVCKPFRNGVLEFRRRDPFESLLPSRAKGQGAVAKEVSDEKVGLIKKRRKFPILILLPFPSGRQALDP